MAPPARASSPAARRSWLAAVVVGGLLLGCATSAPPGPVRAEGSFVYVAPFVDLTPEMRLGLAMTALVQERVYARAPNRFLVVFDDAAGAVDGTVLSIQDVADEANKRDVVVSVRAIVVDKRGRVRHDTGVVDRRARYEVSSDAGETGRRRERALAIATSTVGAALADAILRMP